MQYFGLSEILNAANYSDETSVNARVLWMKSPSYSAGLCGIHYVRTYMQSPPADQLFTEIQDVIRSMPDLPEFGSNPDKCIPWLGRASAAMSEWDFSRSVTLFEPEVQSYVRLQADRDRVNFNPFRHKLLLLLHQAENDLHMRTSGPLSVGISAGRVFEYFEELRKIIETARSDLLIVDPYLDAEFVGRYLPFVAAGTQVRILAREMLSTLKPSVEAYVSQTGLSVRIRKAGGFHDRYLIVDGQACYQSGASFKDGAKKTPTVLTQITDAFVSVRATYEQLWSTATRV